MKHACVSLAALLLASCAMTPLMPFLPTHPASAQAPEAAIVPFQNNLSAPDPMEQQTQMLLDSREK